MSEYYWSKKHCIRNCSDEHKAILAYVRGFITDPVRRQLFDEKGDGRILFDKDVGKHCLYPPMYSLDSFVLVTTNPARITDYQRDKRELIEMLNRISAYYRKHKIVENNGEIRVVRSAKAMLRSYQHVLKRLIFDQMAKLNTSPYAYAYTKGRSFVDNARLHAGARKMMNMDIRHFFDSTMRRHVYDILTKYAPQYNKTIRKLIVDIVTCEGHLVQGACTSPIIANLVLADFDKTIADYCEERHITYSRYCDDLAFSGDDFDDQELYAFVKKELHKLGYYLNKRKTHIASEGQRHMVTGLICNNDQIRVPQSYKREIIKDVHYVMKYGITDHLRHSKPDGFASFFDAEDGRTETSYLYSLFGRINYVLSIEPANAKMLKLREDLHSIETEFIRNYSIDVNRSCRLFKRLISAHPIFLISGFHYDYSDYGRAFKLSLTIQRNINWEPTKFQNAIARVVHNDSTHSGNSYCISNEHSDRLVYYYEIPLSKINSVNGRDYIYACLNDLNDIYTRILFYCQDPIQALEAEDYLNYYSENWDSPFETDIQLPFEKNWENPFDDSPPDSPFD